MDMQVDRFTDRRTDKKKSNRQANRHIAYAHKELRQYDRKPKNIRVNIKRRDRLKLPWTCASLGALATLTL
jgi:hypothetical protein